MLFDSKSAFSFSSCTNKIEVISLTQKTKQSKLGINYQERARTSNFFNFLIWDLLNLGFCFSLTLSSSCRHVLLTTSSYLIWSKQKWRANGKITIYTWSFPFLFLLLFVGKIKALLSLASKLQMHVNMILLVSTKH